MWRELMLDNDQVRHATLHMSSWNRHFEDYVYIVFRRPQYVIDHWPGMRCSCHPNGLYVRCEHTEYLRSLPQEELPERMEPTGESLEFYCARAVVGRKPGSFLTVAGAAKAAAKGKAQAKAMVRAAIGRAKKAASAKALRIKRASSPTPLAIADAGHVHIEI